MLFKQISHKLCGRNYPWVCSFVYGCRNKHTDICLRRRPLGRCSCNHCRPGTGLPCLIQKIIHIANLSGTVHRDALRLMLADKMEELIRIQVEAVKNIKIDKVTVWDGGNQQDGKTATAGFVSGLMKSIPPMNELFNMAGMNLPSFLGETKEPPVQQPALDAERKTPAPEAGK